MRALSVSVAAALLSTAAHAAGMPAGSFTCERMMVSDYSKAGPNDFLPSVLGSFTIDAKGGYVHHDGKGTVAVSKDLVRFMDGPMKGIIAVQRTNAKGKTYLHIDKEIIEMPKAQPRELDVLCVKS